MNFIIIILTVNIGIKGDNLQSRLHDSNYKWLTSYLNYITITINSTYRGICLGYSRNLYLIIYSLTYGSIKLPPLLIVFFKFVPFCCYFSFDLVNYLGLNFEDL